LSEKPLFGDPKIKLDPQSTVDSGEIKKQGSFSEKMDEVLHQAKKRVSTSILAEFKGKHPLNFETNGQLSQIKEIDENTCTKSKNINALMDTFGNACERFENNWTLSQSKNEEIKQKRSRSKKSNIVQNYPEQIQWNKKVMLTKIKARPTLDSEKIEFTEDTNREILKK